MKKPENPCHKDCPDRTGTCHSTCERGLNYDREMAVWRKEKNKHWITDCYTVDEIMRSKRSSRRYKKR